MPFEGFKIEEQMPEFSVLFPSRGRPEQMLKVLQEWRSKCVDLSKVEWILSLDTDDKFVPEYLRLLGDGFDKIVLSHAPTNVSSSMNAAARQAVGAILVCSSDDFGCPDKWDEVLLRKFDSTVEADTLYEDKIGIVYMPNDGINPAGHLCTIPIMDREFYNNWGYVYWEEYPHYCADTDLTYRARLFARNLLIDEDTLFEHRHVDVGKADMDATYYRAASRDQGGIEARQILARRVAGNFGRPQDA